MWIKICANTNLEDARLAAEFGADAVGFVFASSKRQVMADQVAAIVPHLPATLEKIGVFATQDADGIISIVRATGLTGVQLHSSFNPGLVQQLRSALGDEVAIVQTVHLRVDRDTDNAQEVAEQLHAIAEESAIERVLVDSKTVNASGGTGISFDWKAARTALSPNGDSDRLKLIVAGGLRPENVAEAIHALHPWGVDVASGVEDVPGKKDRMKLQRFIENARSVR